MQVLLDKGVDEGKILFLSLIAAPEGVHKICGQYPRVKVVTTEIDEGIAPDFQVIPGTHTSCTDTSVNALAMLKGLPKAVHRQCTGPRRTCTDQCGLQCRCW